MQLTPDQIIIAFVIYGVASTLVAAKALLLCRQWRNKYTGEAEEADYWEGAFDAQTERITALADELEGATLKEQEAERAVHNLREDVRTTQIMNKELRKHFVAAARGLHELGYELMIDGDQVFLTSADDSEAIQVSTEVH